MSKNSLPDFQRYPKKLAKELSALLAQFPKYHIGPQEIVKELEQRAAKAEEERAKTDAVFLGIGDGAVTTDEKGKVSRINKAALDMLGYTEKEIIGKWFHKAIIAEDSEKHPIRPIDRAITQAIFTGKPISKKVYYVRKDGSRFPVSLTVSPILLDKRPVGAIEIFRDATKEEEVDRMKSEFISLASHQLRTPLSAISTYAHMLSDGYVGELNEDQSQFVDVILSSIDRMNELITTLLDISRLEAGTVAVEPKRTDLHKLIKKILHELIPKIEQKALNVDLQIKTDHTVIKTDPFLVREIYTNLVSNAIKYTPPQGKITLSLESKSQQVVFSVKDNGYGIPKSAHDRIFTKFFRADNITRTETTGSGLGLYLVKGIAESIGGEVSFTSRENRGSTFRVSLPKTDAKAKYGFHAVGHQQQNNKKDVR